MAMKLFGEKKKPEAVVVKAKPSKDKVQTAINMSNPLVFIGGVIILVITIVAFVLVPAIVPQAAGSLTTSLEFGTYNGTPISYVPGNYFANIYQNYANEYRSLIEQDSSGYYLMMIWQQAFNEAVVQTAMLDEMKTAAYTPPTDLVDKEVASLAQFQENGRFSPALYRSLSNADRLTLWRQVRDSISVSRYIGDMSGLLVPSAESDFIAGMTAKERSFDMVSYPFSSYPDSEVAAYGNAHPDLFQQVHFSQITSATEDAAKTLRASVESGATTFEDAALNQSIDSYSDKSGDMGQMMAYNFGTTIPDETQRREVMALTSGQISPVVQTPLGWAFFRCEAPMVDADTSNADTLASIRSYMMSFESGQIQDYLSAKAQTVVSDTSTVGFAAAAANAGLEVKSFGPLAINYGNVDLFTQVDASVITELTYASTSEIFWRNAFSTPLGSASSPFVLGDTVLVLYPSAESDSAASMTRAQTSYTGGWVSNAVLNSMGNEFLTSPKLQDNFANTFFNLFYGNS
jgi:hypothetical protein